MLWGDNGQGKTNLLEAVYLLATLRSFRDGRPARWVRDSGGGPAPRARVMGRAQGPAGERELVWQWAAGERSLLLDGTPPGSLEPWFEAIRAVLFCPEHVDVVRGEPEARRTFLDRAVFTARPAHLDLMRAYRRVVQHKAALLRTPGAASSELDLWDQQLASLGARVRVRRRELVAELSEPFQQSIEAIAHGERARLRVRGDEGGSEDEARAALRAALARARPEELRARTALVGPHRDDLEIELDGRLARRFASQGQARTVALALKLAELEAARRRGQRPLFLLDDLGGELDAGRRARLVELLLGLGNQVWVTTTDPSLLGPAGAAHASAWRVRGGAATRVSID